MESEYTFDQLVTIFASDIRSGKIKIKSELYIILEKLTIFPRKKNININIILIELAVLF
jgi:hypothetical protein